MLRIERPDAVVAAFYDEKTGSWQYVVRDRETKSAAIIDPVWDYDEKAGATSTKNADAIADYVRSEGLRVEWVLDTHPHADHFSAAPYLAEKFDAPTAIGEKVTQVQKLWRDIYCLEDFAADGSQWDRLFAEGVLHLLRHGFDAFDVAMASGDGACPVDLAGQRRVEDVVDQGRLAGS